MKHAGKARQAGLKLILLTLGAVLLLIVVGFLAKVIGTFVLTLSSTLVVLWILFTVFTLNFFRDPEARV
ncbi:MAG TPA: hypothetical protein VFR76_13470, partial [Verrucomicrobiae bacterium]|nr:hypothetical protein [Verrucomicrobiae bacterium]